MDEAQRKYLLRNPDALASHISDVLFDETRRAHDDGRGDPDWIRSAVLFLLQDPPRCAPEEGTRLILNKRSERVPQPGDLCCPGGGMDRWDRWLARIVGAPGMPLHGFSHRKHLSLESRREVALLLATALREGFEEMRLLPLGVSFLGLLPSQRLQILSRAIRPVVVRLDRPQVFLPNWEVEAIVSIPLRHLLEPERYARYRVRFEGVQGVEDRVREDFLCFQPERGGVLWGATYRIVTRFLRRVFEFEPPIGDGLEVVHATFDATYLTGRRE